MNAINKDKAATSIEDSISGYGLSFPAILALLFVVNGIAALALVMIFSRFYGVSLACIQAILILTAISLTVWTAHQILTVVIYQNAGSGKPNTVVEWGSIGKLLFQNWRVIRDGISHSGEANLSERFANSFGMACLFAGSVVCVFSEGTRYWPQYSPVTDLLGSLFALSLLICLFDELATLRQIFSVVKSSFGSVYGAVSNSPRICLSLFMAWNFFMTAYGIGSCLPFAIANDLPLVPTFFVLSVIPTLMYGVVITILLAPSLAAFREAQLDSTGF